MADYTAYDWQNSSGGGTPLDESNLDRMEAGIAGSLQKSGGTMTGDLVLAANASADMEATPLQQVESLIAAATGASGNVPVGGIIMWSGSVSSITSGWALCDGGNGTPDLRNKFIVGAGSTYDPGDTGGSSSHDHTVSTNTDSQGEHDHGGSTGQAPAQAEQRATGNESVNYAIHTHPISSGGGHNHSVSTDTSDTDSLPPYYALAYIMRTA